MSGPDFAGVLRPHWRTDCSDAANATDYFRWVRCRCGWESERSSTRVHIPDMHEVWNEHLSAVLHAEVARWLSEDVVATLREMSAKQFDRTGPYNARGAAIWDVAGWLETTTALTIAEQEDDR